MNRVQMFGAQWLPEIETYMRGLLADASPALRGMYAMMRYHMGWEDQMGRPDSAPPGKRVRPLVVLMACLSAGGEPKHAIPAAAAVELIHNFSLIHDDIEDNSPTRRRRPTLWTLVGAPQAINAGDAMFTIARLSLLGLSVAGAPAERLLAALRAFDQTCLRLTEGQHLDMSFEARAQVQVSEYLSMISGKTAALLACSAQLGALVAADEQVAQPYWRFGHELGLSFQIQDDILGIWGDEVQTGKSAASDILTRKKTLPVLHALAQSGPDADALRAFYTLDRDLLPTDLPAILSLLAHLGSREHAAEAARRHAEAALAALDATAGTAEGLGLLGDLAQQLLGRNS